MPIVPANASLNQTVTGHTSWDVVNRKELGGNGKALKASLPQQIQIVATPQNARGPHSIQGAYSTGLPNMYVSADPLNRTVRLPNGSPLRGRVDAMNATGGDFGTGHQTMTNFATRSMGLNQ